MSAGWDLKEGTLKYSAIGDYKLWSLFNFMFSSACHKTNTYKFGLIKSILDNLFNAVPQNNLLLSNIEFSYMDADEKMKIIKNFP